MRHEFMLDLRLRSRSPSEPVPTRVSEPRCQVLGKPQIQLPRLPPLCHRERLRSLQLYAVESPDCLPWTRHSHKPLLPQPLVPLTARFSPISTAPQSIGAAAQALGDTKQPLARPEVSSGHQGRLFKKTASTAAKRLKGFSLFPFTVPLNLSPALLEKE